MLEAQRLTACKLVDETQAERWETAAKALDQDAEVKKLQVAYDQEVLEGAKADALARRSAKVAEVQHQGLVLRDFVAVLGTADGPMREQVVSAVGILTEALAASNSKSAPSMAAALSGLVVPPCVPGRRCRL